MAKHPVSRAARKVLAKHGEKCPRCKGKGRVKVEGRASHEHGVILGKHWTSCPDCGGTGQG